MMKKRILSFALVLCMALGIFGISVPSAGAAEAIGFEDVKEDQWYYEFVMTAAVRGLVNGIDSNTFAPNNNITRAQFATILYRYLGSPTVEGIDTEFRDLTADWYKDAVIYMSHLGVIKGIAKDRFEPGKNITREQMVTMLYRMREEAEETTEYQLSKFKDGDTVSEWARSAMNWAIGEGIISGMNGGVLKPQGNATRAQAAKVICLNFGLSRNVTLRFWQAGGDNAAASTTMRLILDKFELLHPWITVEYEAIPWSDDPHSRFESAIANGDCADVLVMGSPWDFDLAGEGKLLPLDELLSSQVISDIPDILRNQGVYYGGQNSDMYGKIMSVPLYGSNRVMLYNKEIFDYFGVEYPTEGMSHADLLEMAKKLTGEMNGKKVYGLGTRPSSADQYMNFVWNYGAKLIDPETMTAGTDSPEWKKGIQDYMAFYEAGVVPEDAINMPGSHMRELFLNGEVAIFGNAALDYQVYEIIETPVGEGETPWNEKLGVAPLVGETYATTYCGADVMAIPATTQNPQDAGLLLSYLMGTEAQTLYSKTIGYLPTVKSAAADPYFAEDPILSGYVAAMEGGHYFDYYGVAGCGTILKNNLEALLNGEVTIDEYIANLTADINARIDEYLQ